MKALLINGSPHEHGCTYTALRELADTLEAEGIETEIIQAGKTAHACNAWRTRWLSSRRCTTPPPPAGPSRLWTGCFSARPTSTRP